MRYLVLSSALLIASCNSSVLNTAQEINIDLIGTDKAYCVLSTDKNRYSLDAPGTVFVERDSQILEIDCDDNLSSRRRTVRIESNFGLGYWNYPSEVTIDFSKLNNGTRFNGYRADVAKASPQQIIVQHDPSMPPIITEILTEDSYSRPVHTTQDYPVRKDYYMGKRSYPVTP